MSHELVYGLKIEADKVMINSVSNNVSPRQPHWQEYPYFTRLLKEQGKAAVEISLMESYEEGNLQPGTPNRYTRALAILRHMPEYAALNWNVGGIGEDCAARSKYREEHKEDLRKLMRIALDAKPPADKFVITKQSGGDTIYGRKYARCITWSLNAAHASIFRYRQDAENLKKCYTGSEYWSVQQI